MYCMYLTDPYAAVLPLVGFASYVSVHFTFWHVLSLR